MASVRMSHGLQEDIRIKAKAIHASHIESLGTISPEIEAWGDAVYDVIFPYNIQERMKSLPEGWLPTADHMEITTKSLCTSWQEQSTRESINIEVHFSKRRLVPLYTHVELSSWQLRDFFSEDRPFMLNDRSTNLPFPGDHDLIRDWEVRQRALFAARKEQEEFLDSVNAILSSCNTLKQYLEVWPAGRNLVPASSMQKLSEKAPTKKERIEWVREEAELDAQITSRLNTTIFVNKLSPTTEE